MQNVLVDVARSLTSMVEWDQKMSLDMNFL